MPRPCDQSEPHTPKKQDGMAAAGTAEGSWGNLLVASQGGLGTQQEGLKELGEDPSLFSESNREPLTGFSRKAIRPDLHF